MFVSMGTFLLRWWNCYHSSVALQTHWRGNTNFLQGPEKGTYLHFIWWHWPNDLFWLQHVALDAIGKTELQGTGHQRTITGSHDKSGKKSWVYSDTSKSSLNASSLAAARIGLLAQVSCSSSALFHCLISWGFETQCCDLRTNELN